MKSLHVFLIVFAAWLGPGILCSQVLLSELSLQQLRQLKVDRQAVYHELTKRYDSLSTAGQVGEQLGVAKALAVVGYLIQSPSTEAWFVKADSLQTAVQDADYDRWYELNKVAWYHVSKQTAKAIELLHEMEPLALASKDTSWQIDYYMYRVQAHASFDDMAEALKYQLAAEELDQGQQGAAQTANILVGRAAIAWENRDVEAALDYELQAIAIYERIDHPNLPVSYQNAKVQAQKAGKTDIVQDMMARLSQYKLRTGCTKCYFTDELNRVFFLIEAELYHDAITLADAMIAYADSLGRDKSHAIYLKGVAHRGIDRYDLAERYIREAFDIGKDMRHLGKCAFYSHALYQTYYWKDKYEPALEWYQVHTAYRDSVYNEQKAKEIGVFEARLESLEQRRKVTELEGKVEVDRQKRRGLWITILLGGLLGGALLYAQRQRSRRKDAIQKALLLESISEKQKLQQTLEFKEKELASQILHIAQKNNLLQDLMAQIETLQNEDNTSSVGRLVRNIQRSVENSEEWDHFLSTFTSIHSSFLAHLQAMSDSLTANEIRLASLMKMNLSSKEIATMLNISDDGVKKARYRLRKKLQLGSDVSIQDYLLGLGDSLENAG